MKKQHDIATRVIHAGQSPDPTTGAIMTPIYPAFVSAAANAMILTADYADDTDEERQTERQGVEAFCFSFPIRDIRVIRG